MTDSAARLGWIGLGRIGMPMAVRLIRSGHGLVVWDISAAAVETGIAAGAVAAESAADLGRRVDICFLCLPGEGAIESAVFGPEGLAGAASQTLILVDHSTIDPAACRKFAARAAAQSRIRWVDIPISGGIDAAASGDLIAWAGGAESDVGAVAPLLSNYVSKLSRVGPVGQGQLAKSCNQMIVGGTVALWSEMLRYAAAVGLDPAAMVETLKGGAAESPVSRRFADALARHEFPELSIRNLTKDLEVAVSQSAGTAMSPKMTLSALDEFARHIKPKP